MRGGAVCRQVSQQQARPGHTVRVEEIGGGGQCADLEDLGRKETAKRQSLGSGKRGYCSSKWPSHLLWGWSLSLFLSLPSIYPSMSLRLTVGVILLTPFSLFHIYLSQPLTHLCFFPFISLSSLCSCSPHLISVCVSLPVFI